VTTGNYAMANRDSPPPGLDSDPVIPVESLIETLHEPLLVLDAELRVLAASSAFGRMFRIPLAETIGRVVFELGNGRWDFPALHTLLEDVVPERGEVHGYRVEHEFEWPGRLVLIFNIRRVHDARLGRNLILVAIEGIPEPLLVDEPRSRLAAIVESSDDAIISKDLDGVITSWNSGAERLLGYPADEAIGQHITLIIPPDRLSEEAEILDRIRRGVAIDHFETVRQRKDGSLVEISLAVSPVVDRRGRVVGASKIARDITEARYAQQAVRQGEERYRSLLFAAPVALFVCDRNGTIQYYNSRAATLWGNEPVPGSDQYFGGKALRHADGTLIAPEKSPVMSVLRSGHPVSNTEFLVERPDGSRIPVLMNLAPLRGPRGEIVGCVTSFLDISEQKDAQNSLREAGERMNQFLAILAHELRNPLAPIRNALEILRTTEVDVSTVHAASEMMERQVNHMIRLVDDLLDVSRISRGKIDLRRTRTDLTALVGHVVDGARSLAQYKNQEVTLRTTEEPLFLHIDPTRISQVVGNLINNACKFTPDRGHIVVSLDHEEDQAVIRVRDDGIGIPPVHLQRIFDMFTQLDTSLERSESGLGIGLTLAKKLVEMHGGSIEATSAGTGKGTEFTVRFPILTAAEEAITPPTQISLPTLAGRRILVVDDNVDAATSLAMLLSMTGNDTHTAHDGLAALDAAAALRPEIVLLDIGLPKLNGYEVCRRLRREPWGNAMTVIALTGWGQKEDVRNSIEAGFNGHMVKPVELSALAKLLAEVEHGDVPAI
jgi:PAS domain S-box-containing protein